MSDDQAVARESIHAEKHMWKRLAAVLAIATTVVLSPIGIETISAAGAPMQTQARALAIEEVCAAGSCNYELPFLKCCLANNTWRAHTWCQTGNCNEGSGCPGMEVE